MSAADLTRLAAIFGSAPFTSAQAHAQLDAGLGQQPTLRSFSNRLRAAVGYPITSGARTFVLTHAGTAHGGARRWQFEPVPDPDLDILE